MIVNFAAGNAGPGENTLNPYSASPCVMSVVAGDKSGNLADFPSRDVPGDKSTHPDVTAPSRTASRRFLAKTRQRIHP